MSGKDIRLGQLFGKTQRTFILPMDHGITIGPVPGLMDIASVVKQVAGIVDGIVIHKGLARRVVEGLDRKCNLIIHLSASTTLSSDPNRKETVTSVEHAVRLGAAAVSVHVNLGSAFEASMLKDMGKISEQCEYWGMPLLAMMYVRDGKKESEFDPVKIGHAARVAEELGADIVKVNYTGSCESFSEVVKGVEIPVIIAGGPKMSSEEELLSMISDALKAGARGVAIGRNLFQHEAPACLAGKIREILDANA